jgi:integrase/recombinase XerD
MTIEFGVPAEVVEEFLEHLIRRGRGSYTTRSYGLALQDFSGWLREREQLLLDVVRADVETYIDAFARGHRTGGRPPRERRTSVVDLKSNQPKRSVGRAPRTVNHRLSVLGSFFGYLIGRDTDAGQGDWLGRSNPVPQAPAAGPRHGRPGGGDAPVRGRAELRRREPRKLPRDLDPADVQRLIDAAPSWRDRALLILLSRTGQRIGDWSTEHGRHGVLGMTLSDLDRRTSTVIVMLKGARDEHRVPVTAPFWVAFDRYLAEERGDPPTDAAWVGARRGRGRPLTYAAFEAGLRLLGGKVGISVTAHMFRHTVATGLVEHAGVAVAQAVLGHRHVGTTVDSYAHVDRNSLVEAVSAFEQRPAVTIARAQAGQDKYAFHYDLRTIEELDAVALPRLVQEEQP